VLRAVLDVNVFISAQLRADGAPARAYKRWLDGEFELVASDRLIEELGRVGARPHLAPRLDPGAISAVIARLGADGIVIDDPPAPRVVTRDPKDDYLVALARAGRAQAIVTGDRHLLDLDELRPPALEPPAFLVLLERLGG
jgi:putative PIN family toxin of toxin-antitoxin system